MRSATDRTSRPVNRRRSGIRLASGAGGRLREAIRRLNPTIPEEAREEALRKVLRRRNAFARRKNRAFHRMLRDGVAVEYPRTDGSIAGDHVRLIDFDDAARERLAGGEPVHGDRRAAQPAAGHRGFRQRPAARA